MKRPALCSPLFSIMLAVWSAINVDAQSILIPHPDDSILLSSLDEW